jgi:hypothetical protein
MGIGNNDTEYRINMKVFSKLLLLRVLLFSLIAQLVGFILYISVYGIRIFIAQNKPL